jgi:hypothetical protein
MNISIIDILKNCARRCTLMEKKTCTNELYHVSTRHYCTFLLRQADWVILRSEAVKYLRKYNQVLLFVAFKKEVWHKVCKEYHELFRIMFVELHVQCLHFLIRCLDTSNHCIKGSLWLSGDIKWRSYHNCGHLLSLPDRKRQVNGFELLDSISLLAPADKVVLTPGVAVSL